MPVYSEKVLEHFMDPRNVGEIEEADGVGQVGNPVCGDMMNFYIKVEDDRIADVKFKTFGCGAAIAVSSMVSEMAMGKTLDEVKAMTRQDVADALGGLPPNKMHCSNLGTDALQAAVEDYENVQAGRPRTPMPSREEALHEHEEDEICRCPFCNEFFEKELGICTGCGTDVAFCAECEAPLPKEAEECPECGAAVAADVAAT
jgi:nitrogen fixation NifU-like protein